MALPGVQILGGVCLQYTPDFRGVPVARYESAAIQAGVWTSAATLSAARGSIRCTYVFLQLYTVKSGAGSRGASGSMSALPPRERPALRGDWVDSCANVGGCEQAASVDIRRLVRSPKPLASAAVTAYPRHPIIIPLVYTGVLFFPKSQLQLDLGMPQAAPTFERRLRGPWSPSPPSGCPDLNPGRDTSQPSCPASAEGAG